MSEDAIDNGADAALAAIEPLVDTIEMLSDEDRERWWSGFMIAVNGMIRQSVGPAMALMISRACSELSQEEIDGERKKS